MRAAVNEHLDMVDCPWSFEGKNFMIAVPKAFLAEVQREAKAEAWHEGVMAALKAENKTMGERTKALLQNPYRREETE